MNRQAWRYMKAMNTLKYKGSTMSPTINFNARHGVLEINGSSLHEDSDNFYQPLIDWVRQYTKNPVKTTLMHVKMVHFNGNSRKGLLSIFKALEFIERYSKDSVTIHWHYEEEDQGMIEAGQDYDDLVRLEFKLIPARV